MFVCIPPNSKVCHLCGERRRWFHRQDRAFRCWRCPNCEVQDILLFLRGDVGAYTAEQFMRNMGASSWQMFMYRARQDYLAFVATEDARFLQEIGVKWGGFD